MNVIFELSQFNLLYNSTDLNANGAIIISKVRDKSTRLLKYLELSNANSLYGIIRKVYIRVDYALYKRKLPKGINKLFHDVDLYAIKDVHGKSSILYPRRVFTFTCYHICQAGYNNTWYTRLDISRRILQGKERFSTKISKFMLSPLT